MASKKLMYCYCGATDIGHGREHNEDFYICDALSESVHLCALADGMGGYHGGATASKLVIETLYNELESSVKLESKQYSKLLINAATVANQKLREARDGNDSLAKMGTTLVAALFNGRSVDLIHAGDSRCYLFSNDTLTLLTEDDTVAQALLKRGALTLEQALQSPFRHRLTQALGPDKNINFQHQRFNLAGGDRLIFCSDGLYDALTQAQFSAILRKKQAPGRCAEALIQASLDNETNDNSSVIVLSLEMVDDKN